MNLLDKAHKLESQIARTVERAAERLVKPTDREPIEIVHAIVEAIEQEVQSAGRGNHVFPFNRIKASVVALSPEARARLDAVLMGEPSLQSRVVHRLETAGCSVAGLSVKVAYVPQARPEWPARDFNVEFERVAKATAVEPAPTPISGPVSVELTLLAGEATHQQDPFAQARINLGRCPELRDQRNRVIRINHVDLTDSNSATNQTVSRCHAHLEFNADARQYRVYDDGSRQGTGVLRNGKTIPVPAGSRGVGLVAGDEILLGQARLRFTSGQEPVPPKDATSVALL